MDTKTELGAKLEELFGELPLERAMPKLVGPGNSAQQSLVDNIQAPPAVQAGLWLYVDDLNRSHTLSQDIHSPTGSYWHAIMHRREGDFWNAKYWFRKVGSHPVIDQIGYDPSDFVEACEKDQARNSPELLDVQRREWKALFDWSLKEAGLA